MSIFGKDKSKDDLLKEIDELQSEITQLKTSHLKFQPGEQKTSNNHKKNKNLFLSIFEDAGIGMVIINRNLQIVKFNKVLSELSGYKGDELYQMTYLDIVHESKRESASKFIEAMFTSQLNRYEGEQSFYKKDKTLLNVKLTATVVHDEFGIPEYIIGMGEDITEIKKQGKIRDVVNQISNSVNYSNNLFHLINSIKESLKTIIESKYFFIALYDEKKDCFSVPYTIHQKETFENFPAEKTLAGYIQRNRKSVLLNYKEIIELQEKGEIFIAGKLSKQWLGVPLISEEKIIGVIGVQSFDNENAFNHNDLTIIEILSNQISTSIQKMRSEEALKIERAYFKELFENSPEAIAIVDNSSIVININKEFTNLFGYSKEEAFHQPIEKLISTEEYHDEAVKITNEISKGKIIKTDTRRKKKDGSIVDVSIWGTPIILDEGQIAVYAIFRDITERVESEQNLKEAKEKAEESDKLKTAFLTNMSHEIRTPMNAIIGFSELIAEPNVDYESRKEFKQQIFASSNILLKLIDDIIDISQIDAGEIKTKIQKFNVTGVLKEYLQKFEQNKITEQKENLEILLHNPFGDHVAYIETDEFRFRQIMNHMISNAFKYTHDGFIEFGFEIDQSDNPVFYIRDTGIGIPSDKKDLIFKHFTKIEDRTKLYRGTGIGLTITQKLVNLLGGKIWVDSHIGIGSIFYFTIPSKIKLLEIPNSNKLNIFKYNWNGKKILIAEDEDTNYEVLRATFSKTYASLTRVTQGDQAIEYCMKNDYDIVLMDLKMPVLDGIEATKQIKKFKPNLPIIGQTAFIYKNERDTCLEAGFDEYVPKPIKSYELLELISKFID